MPVNTVISANYDRLTRSEKKAADYIVENFSNVVYSTLSKLSKDIGVGEATIVRFVEKCGYHNFQSFKYEMIKDFEHIKENNTDGDFADALFNAVQREITSTNYLLDREVLAKATEMIKKAKNIYFLGIGHSGIIAEFGAYRFMRLGKKAQAVSDAHFQSIIAAISNETDIVIAISMSGNSPELLKPLSVVNNRGIQIIGITACNHTPLEKLSTYTLIASGGKKDMRYKTTGTDSITTLVNELLIIDILLESYINTDREEILANSAIMTSNLQDTRDY